VDEGICGGFERVQLAQKPHVYRLTTPIPREPLFCLTVCADYASMIIDEVTHKHPLWGYREVLDYQPGIQAI
jgi:hypothetical protein